MKIFDVIILGAGASGLMCAGNIGKKKSVLIIEGNEKVAKKLKISGGGKCNITNVSVESNNFDGEELLVESVLQKFSKDNLLNFLDRSRVELELRKERYYFCQNSADDIINVLKNASKHAEIHLNEKIISLDKENELFSLTTDKAIYKAKNVVVATGGISFVNLGASSIGLDIAKSFDIEVREFTPALVGLTVQKEQFWMRELSGLSCYVNIKVGDRVAKEEMLFAHKGISGPAVLTASLYWKKGLMSIDFLPDRDITKLVIGSKKQVSSLLNLPKRLSRALLKAVAVEDKECKKLTKEDIQNLSKLHAYSFAPAGNFGFTKAEVSRGGVLANEIEFKTCETKNIQGLYFIGEVVDITGELGGYNFQWAFSSAYVCAKAIK
ncbi:aminoacetone oxidase family FAD-binding enzyme [Sulfurimonas sp. SAG-AH-194-C20]|nr:aminoacetone oxidase family FAD-binding enzyme [Sulfurimonas sp. SAG-AH-194-C20]MDF1878556.1 aminoacetone oxidase family FAD-binding enzyme [Sulfurimonas sp. SAG-AH-194-C20]